MHNAQSAPSAIEELLPCSWFHDKETGKEIRFVDMRTGGKALYHLLKDGTRSFSELKHQLHSGQITLLKNLILDGFVMVEKIALTKIN